jgi:hypothetical protein
MAIGDVVLERLVEVWWDQDRCPDLGSEAACAAHLKVKQPRRECGDADLQELKRTRVLNGSFSPGGASSAYSWYTEKYRTKPKAEIKSASERADTNKNFTS